MRRRTVLDVSIVRLSLARQLSVLQFAAIRWTIRLPIVRDRYPCGPSNKPAGNNDQKAKRPPIVGAMLLL